MVAGSSRDLACWWQAMASLLETDFGLDWLREGLALQQLALEPMHLCKPVALPAGLSYSQDLAQQAQPLRDLVGVPHSVGERD